MTAEHITEILGIVTFLSLWLGLAICIVATFSFAVRHPKFWGMRFADRGIAISDAFRQSDQFLRNSKTGRAANALLMFGTVCAVLTACAVIYGLAVRG